MYFFGNSPDIYLAEVFLHILPICAAASMAVHFMVFFYLGFYGRNFVGEKKTPT